MKIIAIGGMPLDLEIGCFGTLYKYIKYGHEVYLIVVGKTNWAAKNLKTLKESSKEIGVTEIYHVERFDYSSITQDNVNVLRSFIEAIMPSLAILPFTKASHPRRKNLAKSSLLACREIENILMYESNMNTNFSPNVYSLIDNETPVKESCIEAYARDASAKKKIKKKIKLLQSYYTQESDLGGPVEVFESHKILLNNDIF